MVNAAVEQSRCKVNRAAQWDLKFGPWADPPNQTGKAICEMMMNSYVFPCLKETTPTLGMSSSILLNISTFLLEMLFGFVSGPSEKRPLHKTTAGYSEGLVPSSRLETWPMLCSRSFLKACQNMRVGLNMFWGILFKLILYYHGIFIPLSSINQLYGLQIFVPIT